MTQNEMQALLGPVNRLLDHAKAGSKMPDKARPDNFAELLLMLVDVILPESDDDEERFNNGKGVPLLNDPGDLQMGARMRTSRSVEPSRQAISRAKYAMLQRMDALR